MSLFRCEMNFIPQKTIYMKRLSFLFTLMLCVQITSAQLILKENFDYAIGNVTDNEAWTAYSSAGSEAVQVFEGGLQLDGYNFTDIDGKAIKLNPSKQGTEDVYVKFSSPVNMTNGAV